MRSAWLLALPLLFAPNFGLAWSTPYGMWEFSDYLILPFVLLVASVAAPAAPLQSTGIRLPPLTALLVAFVGWATLTTLLIPIQYDLAGTHEVRRGLVKLGKLLAYGSAGVLVARALAHTGRFRAYVAAVVGAGCLAAIALFLTREPQSTAALMGFRAGNAVSVAVAMLLVFLIGTLVAERRSLADHRLAYAALALMLIGLAVSRGRGGWLALGAGMLYIAWRVRLHRRLLVTGLVGASLTVAAWRYLPEFRHDVLATLGPHAEAAEYSAVPGFDDGARVWTWTREARKFVASPVLGTGFFHRGGASGLWATGSHNFWLQMFLETGVVGGLLVLAIFITLWREASAGAVREARFEIPVKAALATAAVGGMGGEYFYGGMPLLALFVVAAPALAANRRVRPEGVP